MTNPFEVEAPTVDDTVQIPDFTIKDKRIPFRVDDDVFYARGALSLALMQQLVKTAEGLNDAVKANNFSGIVDLFGKLLTPESVERFTQRITSEDSDDALDVKRQLLPIMYYIMEKHGVRPTQQSSGS